MKKELCAKAGFWVIMISFSYLVIKLLVADVPLNIATWGLWVVIDTFLLIACLKAAKEEGSGKPWSMIGFEVGACTIAGIAIIKIFIGKGELSWGGTETLTAISTAVALGIWKFSKTPKVQVVSITLAMYVAMVPTFVDQWSNPVGQDPWVWLGCTIGCILDFYSKPKKIATAFQPGMGILANGFAFILCIKQFI